MDRDTDTVRCSLVSSCAVKSKVDNLCSIQHFASTFKSFEHPLLTPSFSSSPCSDPDSEEKETELKASALIDAIMREDVPKPVHIDDSSDVTLEEVSLKKQKNVLLVDHEDSFVHTLANYLRQTGAIDCSATQSNLADVMLYDVM